MGYVATGVVADVVLVAFALSRPAGGGTDPRSADTYNLGYDCAQASWQTAENDPKIEIRASSPRILQRLLLAVSAASRAVQRVPRDSRPNSALRSRAAQPRSAGVTASE